MNASCREGENAGSVCISLVLAKNHRSTSCANEQVCIARTPRRGGQILPLPTLLLGYHYALHSTPLYSTPIWFSVGVHVQIPTFNLSRRNRRQASRGRWEEFFCRFFGGCSQNRSLMHCAQAEHRFTHASPPDPRVGTAIRASPGHRRIRASISQNRPPPKRKP